MRNTISILTILTLLSCQTGNPNSENSTLNIQQENSNNIEADTERTYIFDSSYLNYDYETDLKGDYRLEYRVFVESNFPDTLQTIFLMKGSEEIRDLNGGSSYGLPHKNIGYIGADFDSSFVFVQSFGSGNPHEIQLIDKKSGKELIKGTWVDADETEQVLLYIENEALIIYDTKNRNEIISEGFETSKCVEHVIGGLRNCVEIDTVTTDEIVLKIDTDEERIIKKYNR